MDYARPLSGIPERSCTEGTGARRSDRRRVCASRFAEARRFISPIRTCHPPSFSLVDREVAGLPRSGLTGGLVDSALVAPVPHFLSAPLSGDFVRGVGSGECPAFPLPFIPFRNSTSPSLGGGVSGYFWLERRGDDLGTYEGDGRRREDSALMRAIRYLAF